MGAPPMASGPDKVRRAFKAWDVSGSGQISRRHLLGIIRRLDPAMSEAELEVLLGAAGANADGRLDYEEFLAWLWSDFQDCGDISQGLSDAEAAEEAARARGLWEGSLAAARSWASSTYPAERVQRYFDEIEARLRSHEYAAHVRHEVFKGADADNDGRLSFAEVAPLIGKSLRCAADLGRCPRPKPQEIRAAFDAHDTLAEGRGYLGQDEFLNLQRYLQVRVAEAMLPYSQMVRGG